MSNKFSFRKNQYLLHHKRGLKSITFMTFHNFKWPLRSKIYDFILHLELMWKYIYKGINRCLCSWVILKNLIFKFFLVKRVNTRAVGDLKLSNPIFYNQSFILYPKGGFCEMGQKSFKLPPPYYNEISILSTCWF